MSALKTIFALVTLFFTMNWNAAIGAETVGGDVYVGGPTASLETGSPRNAFVSGFSAILGGDVTGDGHVVGFDVDADATTGGDVYAFGATVSVSGRVGRDLSAGGFSVRLRDGAAVAGNARLSGGSVIISAPITGSLVAAGGSVELNSAIGGDVRLAAGEIKFGNDARIGGNLEYSAPSEIDIPSSVIAPERVRFSPITQPAVFRDMRDITGAREWSFWPSFIAVVGAFVVTLLFLLVVGAVLLAIMPITVERAREQASERPGPSLLAGFFGLATLIGLVPVSAMTLIGIPLVPIVILFIVLTWTLAYILGSYTLSLRIAAAFREIPDTNFAKLVVLAAGLVVLAVFNFIPVAGWLVNLAVVLLGLGAIAILITRGMFGISIGHQVAQGPAEPAVSGDAGESAPET